MGTTSDRDDPRLSYGQDTEPVPQAAVYLVLSDAERKRGWIRPYREGYKHVGPQGPKYLLHDLTFEQKNTYLGSGYVKYEKYPEDKESSTIGRFWTQEQLDAVGSGCGVVTWMGAPIAETYAKSPSFYGSTYCVNCRMHRPVDEFVWVDQKTGRVTEERVGS